MTASRRATVGHAAPFAAYVVLMGIERAAGLPAQIFYPLRLAAAAAMLLLFSRHYLSLRPSRPAGSVLLGAAVFAIWVAPDLLFGYRHSWLFENALTGRAGEAGAPPGGTAFVALRAAGSFLLVPIVEELFWRGWLMRWLIRPDFLQVRFGAYAPFAFWATALLFASEHGVYWEVGLAAGILYNWWAMRAKTLADCVLAHAVTNAILSAYVLAAGRWQYWP